MLSNEEEKKITYKCCIKNSVDTLLIGFITSILMFMVGFYFVKWDAIYIALLHFGALLFVCLLTSAIMIGGIGEIVANKIIKGV